MKKIRLLLVFLCVLTSANALGQEYAPFVKEGKTWNYKEYYQNIWNDEQWTKDISYVIHGTTEIDGLTYHKMYRISEGDSTYYCALREEDKKVWIYRRYDEHELLYDFGMSIGDSYLLSYNWYYYQLTSIEPMQFHNNQTRNVYHYDILVQWDPDEPATFYDSAPIVEGVGCEEGWNIQRLYEPSPTNGIIWGEDFLSCYEDGECIFTFDEFKALKKTKIDEAIANHKTIGSNSIYHLQGQRIRSLQKGLNIVKGRKVVRK